MNAESLFDLQDLSKLSLTSAAENVVNLNTTQKFEAMLSGYAGVSPKERDAMIHRVAGCLDIEAENDDLWSSNMRELHIQKELLTEEFDVSRAGIINELRRRAEGFGISADPEFVEFKKMDGSVFSDEDQFNTKVDDFISELGTRLRPLNIAQKRRLAEKENQIAIHKQRRVGMFSEAGKAADLLRKELDDQLNDQEAIPPKADGECVKMVEILRRKTGVAADAEQLMPLKNVRGEPTMQAQLLALLYGLSVAGAQVMTYYQSLVLLNRARKGFSDMYEGANLGQEFMNSEVMQEIEHANALIAAGFSPMRWRAAFQKPIRGMVEQMLSEWERGGYRTLTLPQLHSLFLAPVGSSQAITLSLPDEQREVKDEGVDKMKDALAEVFALFGFEMKKDTQQEVDLALQEEEEQNAAI